MKKNVLLVIIGNKVRMERKERGYSQEGFANRVRMGRSYVGRIERGEQNMSMIQLFKIAKVLRVDWLDLLPSLREIVRHG